MGKTALDYSDVACALGIRNGGGAQHKVIEAEDIHEIVFIV